MVGVHTMPAHWQQLFSDSLTRKDIGLSRESSVRAQTLAESPSILARMGA